MGGAQQPVAVDDAGHLRQYLHRETGRYYAIWIQRDLFDTWCVMRAWGGSGTHRGRILTTPMPDLAGCIERMAMEEERRRKRGYFNVRQG